MSAKFIVIGLFAAVTGLAAFQLTDRDSLFVDAPQAPTDSASALVPGLPNS